MLKNIWTIFKNHQIKGMMLPFIFLGVLTDGTVLNKLLGDVFG